MFEGIPLSKFIAPYVPQIGQQVKDACKKQDAFSCVRKVKSKHIKGHRSHQRAIECN